MGKTKTENLPDSTNTAALVAAMPDLNEIQASAERLRAERALTVLELQADVAAREAAIETLEREDEAAAGTLGEDELERRALAVFVPLYALKLKRTARDAAIAAEATARQDVQVATLKVLERDSKLKREAEGRELIAYAAATSVYVEATNATRAVAVERYEADLAVARMRETLMGTRRPHVPGEFDQPQAYQTDHVADLTQLRRFLAGLPDEFLWELHANKVTEHIDLRAIGERYVAQAAN